MGKGQRNSVEILSANGKADPSASGRGRPRPEGRDDTFGYEHFQGHDLNRARQRLNTETTERRAQRSRRNTDRGCRRTTRGYRSRGTVARLATTEEKRQQGCRTPKKEKPRL